MAYVCPACGYDGLEEQPWTDGSASYEICPSCGIQFGYTDWAGGDVVRRASVYATWRERWRAEGLRWSSPGEGPPPGWDPVRQLLRVADASP
jgi:hypothetical protein